MHKLNKISTSEKKMLLEALVKPDDDFLDLCELLEDSEEDEDEEKFLLELMNETSARKKRNCIKDYFECVVPTYTEKEFMTHFRIKKSLFEDLAKRYESSEVFLKLREDKRIHADKSLAVFLWFAGHEACAFRDLADRFNVSISCVSNIIQRVTIFVSSLSPVAITWPNESEKQKSSEFFKSKAGFSKAFGCIDGTHILIDPPAESKDEYIDRKGKTSIILQGVCNEKKAFIHVFIGYPGSCHDSWVYKNSKVIEKLKSCGDYYLFGDSAYPCTKNLLTPYRDNGHLTKDQKNFNVKLSSCRVAIEHTFGILKQRFRQLYYCKLKGMEKLVHFIRACCVLHNIAGEDDLDFILDDEKQMTSQNEPLPYGEMTKGNAVRDPICLELELPK